MTGPLLITGGRGYIGAALVRAALAQGREVVALSRGPEGLPEGVAYLQWSMGQPLPEAAKGAAALIHLAHDWDEVGNLDAAIALRDSARALGIARTVFASSISARPDALNRYGRAKCAIERQFDATNEVSLRIGLVYGGPRKAMYGLLCKLVRLPVLPMIAPGQKVQPIHVTEVAAGLLAAADKDVHGALGLGAAEPVSFADFLKALGLSVRGGRPAILPVPVKPMLMLAALVSSTVLSRLVNRERILGLAGTRAIATGPDLKALDLKLMSFAEGLAREPMARRRRLAEGRTFLHYILGTTPGAGLVRRYARAIGPVPPLAIGGVFHRWPSFLRFAEPVGGEGEMARRLRIASALAEASPQGEAMLKRVSLPRLAAQGLLDGLALPFRLIAGAGAR